MKKALPAISGFFKQYTNWYRLVVGLGFIIATVLSLTAPVPMPYPDDWAFYYGVENFSRGQLTIDRTTLYTEAWEAAQHKGWLAQYLQVGDNRWALEKSPGYIFYLVPFYKMGIPRGGNIALSLGIVIVTYLLLKRLRDEKTAMIGSLLMLFTPVAMASVNKVYMDSYASLAFITMGGGLYLYHHLQRKTIGAWRGGIILFLAFLFLGWSVVTRYSNLPVVLLVFLHLVITRMIEWRRKDASTFKREFFPLLLGIWLPMAALLLYDFFIFGSPFKTGYSISPYPIKFAFQYWGQIDTNGLSIPGEILLYNLQADAHNFLLGFPILAIGVPAFGFILYQKFSKRPELENRWSGLGAELPWDTLLLLAGWFLIVLLTYLLYEWTAGLRDGGGFLMLNRFYLPWLLPVVVVCSLVMAHLSWKIYIPLLAAAVVWGAALYAQWAWNLHILPAWLTSEDYVWPPWMIKFYYRAPY
jgi:hypothetical protein